MKNKLIFSIIFLIVFTTNIIASSQSSKDTIILLVPGTGIDPKTFSSDPFGKKEFTQQDELIKYLVNDLKIDRTRIYTYGFADPDAMRRISELGLPKYKNRAGTGKDTRLQTGVDPAKDKSLNPLDFGNNQLTTAANAIAGTIQDKAGVLKEELGNIPLPQAQTIAPQKIIAITYGDGAQIVRGYINSAELVKNGVFKNLTGTDFIDSQVLTNLQNAQANFADAQSKYNDALKKYSQAVGDFQSEWQKVSQLDPNALSAESESQLRRALNSAKIYAALELNKQVSEIKNLSDGSIQTELAKISPMWAQVGLAEQLLNNPGSLTKEESLSAATTAMQFEFEKINPTAKAFLNLNQTGFTYENIEKAIMINPSYSTDTAKKLLLISLISKLMVDISEKGYELALQSSSLLNKAGNYQFLQGITGSLSSEVSGFMNTALKNGQANAQGVKEATKLSFAILRAGLVIGVLTGHEKEVMDAVDRGFAYTDSKGGKHSGWSALEEAYQFLTVMYAYEDSASEQLKNVSGSLDTDLSGMALMKANAYLSSSLTQLRNTDYGKACGWNWEILLSEEKKSAELQVISAVSSTAVSDAASSVIILNRLGIRDPVNLYFDYVRVGIKGVLKQKSVSRIIHSNFARHYFTLDSQNLTDQLNQLKGSVDSKQESLKEELDNLGESIGQKKTEYKEIAAKSSVAIDGTISRYLMAINAVNELPGGKDVLKSGRDLLTKALPKEWGVGEVNLGWILAFSNSDFWNLPNWDMKFLNLALTDYDGMFSKMGSFAQDMEVDIARVNEFSGQANAMKADLSFVQSSGMEGYFISTVPITIGGEFILEAAIDTVLLLISLPPLPPVAKGGLRLCTMGLTTMDLAQRVTGALGKLDASAAVNSPKASGIAELLKKELFFTPYISLDGIYEELDVANISTVNTVAGDSRILSTYRATNMSKSGVNIAGVRYKNAAEAMIKTNFEAAPMYWPDYDVTGRRVVYKDSSQSAIGAQIGKLTSLVEANTNSGKIYMKRKRDLAFKPETKLSSSSLKIYGSADSLVTNSGDSNTYAFQVLVTSANSMILRGTFNDFTPTNSSCEYSYNFSGWSKLDILNDYGHFELGPLVLAEGQNVISLRMSNAGGYSSTQQIKILKSSVSLQPVMDGIMPVPGSYINQKNIFLKLAYQNMKYSQTAGNKLWIDELSILRESIASVNSVSSNTTATGSVMTYIPMVKLARNIADPNSKISASGYSETAIVTKENLNRIEVGYALNVTQDGKYMVQVKARDEYGATSFLRYEFVVDTTKPVIRIGPAALRK